MRCPYCNSTKIEHTTNVKFKTEDVNALACGACGKEVRQFGGILPCINDFLRVFESKHHDPNIGQVKIGNTTMAIGDAGIYQSTVFVSHLPPHYVLRMGSYMIDIFKLNDALNKEFCSEAT